MARAGAGRANQGRNIVKRYVSWLAAAAIVLLGVVGVALLLPADKYEASDPALLAATGRPQLVEFFHHA